MNCDKSYLTKYDGGNGYGIGTGIGTGTGTGSGIEIGIGTVSGIDFDNFKNHEVIFSKKKEFLKINENVCFSMFESKVEELLLKLIFVNSIKEQTSIDDFINIIDNNTLGSKMFNVIKNIDDFINDLNKKIINSGQIKRKKNLIEFEF